MSSTEPTPTKNFYVHIGAPEPIILQLRSGKGGPLNSFDASLKFMYVNAAGSTILTVGNGITLSTDEEVTDSRATIRLTIAQSRAIPKGAKTRFEVQRVADGEEEVFLMGKLIGEGGDNPDE